LNLVLPGLIGVREARHTIRPQQDGVAYLEEVWGVAEKERTVEPYAGGYRDALEDLIERADQNTLLRLLIDLPLAEDVTGE